jgi:hypothetical protein
MERVAKDKLLSIKVKMRDRSFSMMAFWMKMQFVQPKQPFTHHGEVL